jgi:hypothetical protein
LREYSAWQPQRRIPTLSREGPGKKNRADARIPPVVSSPGPNLGPAIIPAYAAGPGQVRVLDRQLLDQRIAPRGPKPR